MAEKHPNEQQELWSHFADRVIIDRRHQIELLFDSNELKVIGEGQKMEEAVLRQVLEDYLKWTARSKISAEASAASNAAKLSAIRRARASLRHLGWTTGPQQPAPEMARLLRVTSWFPAPSTRRKLEKFLADQETDIAALLKNGQHKTAKWLLYWSYVLLFWYGLKDLALGIAKTVRGKSSA